MYSKTLQSSAAQWEVRFLSIPLHSQLNSIGGQLSTTPRLRDPCWFLFPSGSLAAGCRSLSTAPGDVCIDVPSVKQQNRRLRRGNAVSLSSSLSAPKTSKIQEIVKFIHAVGSFLQSDNRFVFHHVCLLT